VSCYSDSLPNEKSVLTLMIVTDMRMNNANAETVHVRPTIPSLGVLSSFLWSPPPKYHSP
jgi:hypothetical protein